MSEQEIENLRRGFKAIDDAAKSWVQLHGRGIYITEKDIENVENILKSALVGGLILSAFLGEKKKEKELGT